ncbi:unnamed protein product [Dibothriocephalus latus]|uniref:Metalloendopeptidase n=1 Tax=Dibothriocephalus latus TaxID=60516 RepID=A0A3P6TYV2_DIBLA|nr:unnamed protein product [Dibothriocephalus latus]
MPNSGGNIEIKTSVKLQKADGLVMSVQLYGLYMHELGHVIGLDHEHIRADRDSFVDVSLEGVPKDYWGFYARKDRAELSTYGTPYDLQSVMHYGPGRFLLYQSFSIHANKSPLTVRDPAVRHILREVYTKDISFWDAKAINQHYECAIFSKRRCTDLLSIAECTTLENQLECYRNASYMAVKCRNTCGFCYKESFAQIQKQKRNCDDFHVNCPLWQKGDQCTKNAKYMRLMCAKSCHLCGGSTEQTTIDPAACRDTYLYPDDCKDWAARAGSPDVVKTTSAAKVQSRAYLNPNVLHKQPVIARPLPSVGVCAKGDPARICPLHYRACTTVEIFRRCPNICGNCGKLTKIDSFFIRV